MAPDKIYVAESLIKTPYGNEWSPTPYISRENTEYIRKDALLEWLRKEYETISWYHEKMQHVTGCVGNTDSSGKAEAYKKVIDKLISL